MVETPRTFAIRTFGCQMNEHDSERLAGLLVTEGHGARRGRDRDADVVIFNTCTIRENADLKLYSALGQLKAQKERRPDMQIAVGGCMAQKDRGQILERARLGRRGLWHAQSGRGAALLRRRRAAKGPSSTSGTRPTPRRTATWRRRCTRCANCPARRG